MIDVKTADKELQTYIRPQTFPVAIRMLRHGEPVPEGLRIPSKSLGENWIVCQSIGVARRYGWAPRGQRCRLPMPCGHYKTTTITAALRTSGLTATAIFEGATNGRRFLDYVTDTLMNLWPN